MSNVSADLTPDLSPAPEYKATDPQKAWGRFEAAMRQILKSPKDIAPAAEEAPAPNRKDTVESAGKA